MLFLMPTMPYLPKKPIRLACLMLCNETVDDLHKKIARYQDGLILSYKNDNMIVFCAKNTQKTIILSSDLYYND